MWISFAFCAAAEAALPPELPRESLSLDARDTRTSGIAFVISWWVIAIVSDERIFQAKCQAGPQHFRNERFVLHLRAKCRECN